MAGVSTGTPYSQRIPDQLGLPAADVLHVHRPHKCLRHAGGGSGHGVRLHRDGHRRILGAITSDRRQDGPGWAFANKVGTYANINGGGSLTIEGGYPFSNSSHPGGCNMGFCDGGVRFISNTIDGTVYSKMITSAGSKLPYYVKQLPLNQDSFTN